MLHDAEGELGAGPLERHLLAVECERGLKLPLIPVFACEYAAAPRGARARALQARAAGDVLKHAQGAFGIGHRAAADVRLDKVRG